MSRSLPDDLLAAIDQGTVRLLVMVRVDFDSGTLAWHNGLQSVTYAGQEYLPTGNLGGISAISETPGGTPQAVNINLGGIDESFVALLMDEEFTGRDAFIYIALADEDYRVDPDNVLLIFSGQVNGLDGSMGSQAGFSLSVQSRMADWERIRALKYTDADQQSLYPGDKGFEYVPQMSQKKLIWPRAKFLPDPRD